MSFSFSRFISSALYGLILSRRGIKVAIAIITITSLGAAYALMRIGGQFETRMLQRARFENDSQLHLSARRVEDFFRSQYMQILLRELSVDSNHSDLISERDLAKLLDDEVERFKIVGPRAQDGPRGGRGRPQGGPPMLSDIRPQLPFPDMEPPDMVFEGDRNGPGGPMDMQRAERLAKEVLDSLGLSRSDIRVTAALIDPDEMTASESQTLSGWKDSTGLIYVLRVQKGARGVSYGAAYVSTAQLLKLVDVGQDRHRAILVNENGVLVASADSSDSSLPWLQSQFKDKTIAGFFESATPELSLDRWDLSWQPIPVLDDQKWWLARELNVEAKRAELMGQRAIAVYGLPFGIIALGLLLSSLLVGMRGRQMEQARHAAERENTLRTLEQSLALLGATLESSADAIVAVDVNGVPTTFNSQFATYGWLEPRSSSRDGQQTLMQHLMDLAVEPEDVERHFKALLSEDCAEGQFTFELTDGRTIEMHSKRQSVGDIGAGRVFTLHDATERYRTEADIRSREEYLRSIFNNSHDVISVLDPDGKLLFSSPSHERITGFPLSGGKGRYLREIVHPDDYGTLKSALDSLVQGRAENRPIEFRVKHESGGYRILETTASLATDPAGQPVVVASSRDITDRKKADEQISRLQLAIEQNPISVLVMDVDGRIEYVNPAFCRITGFSADEVRGQDSSVFRSDLVPREVSEDIMRALLSGNIWKGVLTNRRKDGETYWEEVTVSSVRDATGKVISYVAAADDITDRIKSQYELKKFSVAVDQSGNMIGIADAEGTIEYINPKFSEVTGFTLSDLVGRSVHVTVVDTEDSERAHSIWTSVRQGNVWQGMVQSRKKSGEIFWERKVITPIHGEKGEIVNYLSVGEDITTELETQQKLVESDKLAAIGVLAAGVSHEFKNFLGGIIGNASFALDELQTESAGNIDLAKETLSQIIEMGERANQLAMSLLTYSKAKSVDRTLTDLQKLITTTIALVEKEMKHRDIELVTYFETVPPVSVSASKIQQVLLNLLLNAEQAIGEQGTITVALSREQDVIKIKVGDSGGGIDSNVIGKIFDPFFSTKGVWGKDKVVGTGMGLAICRNIAREHDGDLAVETIVGIGTTFSLTLPLDKSEGGIETTWMPHRALKFLIFSLDRAIQSHYFKEACAHDIELLQADSMEELDVDLSGVVDLVIADARFAGKVELFRMIERCRESGVPYIMVNCGAMEYQLSHLYETALGNFPKLPEFSRIHSTLALGIATSRTTAKKSLSALPTEPV